MDLHTQKGLRIGVDSSREAYEAGWKFPAPIPSHSRMKDVRKLIKVHITTYGITPFYTGKL